MILIIPSIELKNGKCCQKITGLGEDSSLFINISEHPNLLIKLLRRENAKSAYILDSDSFDENCKFDNWERIEKIKNSTDIPIQLEFNFKTIQDLDFAIKIGIKRLIISFNFFLQNINEILDYGNKNGFSSISIKMIYSNSLEFENVLKIISKNKIFRIVLKDYNIIDLEEISNISKKYKVNITLKENINTSRELLDLNNHKLPSIDSLILGKALYQNSFPCQKIWREAEELLEPELI